MSLALLASSSAIAIDSHTKERANKEDYSNVKELAKELDKFSKEKLDPRGLFMLAEVIWPDNKELLGKEDDDAYLQVNLLAKDLDYFRKFPRERQKELRDICVKLSKKSMDYSDPYRIGLAI